MGIFMGKSPKPPGDGPEPPWRPQLEKLALRPSVRAHITFFAARSEKRTLAGVVSAIRYDRERDEIELRLTADAGSQLGLRVYFAEPAQVGVEETSDLTTIRARDRCGSVAIVRLFAAGAEETGGDPSLR
jgi:hypothetical protein